MNISDPPHIIKDTQAVMLVDSFIHREGITDRRGPITDVAGMVTFTDKICGIVQVIDPAGTIQVGVLHTDGTTLKFGILSSDRSAKTDITIGSPVPVSPYLLVDAKPALHGGTYIGLATQDSLAPALESLILWRGGTKANYTTGTVTTTYGSKSITGSGTSWSANIVPGMFLIDNNSQYVGTVASVTSNTALVLEQPPLSLLGGAACTFQSLRGFSPIAVQGTITASTGSAAVTGADSFFRDEGLVSGYKIFRASDGAFVGTVSSVTNNTALTLGSNAAINCSEDEYIAVNNSGDYGFSITDATKRKPGFLNAVYAGRQWFANRGVSADAGGEWLNRLWFTETSDQEAIDMSVVTGNFIPVISGSGASTPIKSIIPAFNSLVVLKEQEAFALIGQNENQFELKKLSDDGTLSTMSAVSYRGGVIWAGRNGIYYFDGVLQNNITDATLGIAYQEAVKDFDPNTHRMWGSVVRDHYFLHIEKYESTIPLVKGVTPTDFSEITICIYMPREAITFHKNLNLRGSTLLSATLGQQAWFAVNSATVGHICTYDTLFDVDGTDTIACDGGTAGPDWYIESKHYSLGDDLLKKTFKQVMIEYLVGGDTLKLDTVLGLNEVGQTSATTYPVTVYVWDNLPAIYPTWDALAAAYPTWDSLVSGIFFTKRIKFLKRGQFMAFRLYQSSTAVTSAKLASFAIGFKPLRPGRI